MEGMLYTIPGYIPFCIPHTLPGRVCGYGVWNIQGVNPLFVYLNVLFFGASSPFGAHQPLGFSNSESLVGLFSALSYDRATC